MPIKLEIPNNPELFPVFLEPPRGNLEGVVQPGGKLMELYAEDIKLKPTAREEGLFSLSVDGISRALWYQSRFVLEGQPQKVEPVSRAQFGSSPSFPFSPTSRRNFSSASRLTTLLRMQRLSFGLAITKDRNSKMTSSPGAIRRSFGTSGLIPEEKAEASCSKHQLAIGPRSSTSLA